MQKKTENKAKLLLLVTAEYLGKSKRLSPGGAETGQWLSTFMFRLMMEKEPEVASEIVDSVFTS